MIKPCGFVILSMLCCVTRTRSQSCAPSHPSLSSSLSAPCRVSLPASAAIAGISTSPACTPRPAPNTSHCLLALPAYPRPCGLRYCHRHHLHGELLVRGARPRLRGVYVCMYVSVSFLRSTKLTAERRLRNGAKTKAGPLEAEQLSRLGNIALVR